MTRALPHSLPQIVVLALSVVLHAQTDGTRDEDFARRQYESGLSFMRDRQYAEALKDFQAVAEGFPKSSVADDALLQMALYQLDVAGDRASAQTTVDALIKGYPDADSAPMGYVLAGRLIVAAGRSAANIESALASFERVPRLFPTSDAVPAALYHAGETLRIARRSEDALERFRRVSAEYPRSIWAARATLASGQSLVQSARVPRAFDEIQRIRRQFPGTPEAATALDYNTLLFRLYVRPPAQPAYQFANRFIGGQNLRFRDVVGLRARAEGGVVIGHRAGISVLDGKGALLREVPAERPSAFALDADGRITYARRENLQTEGGQPVLIQASEPNGRFHLVEEMPSFVVLSSGERVVSDRSGNTVIKLDSGGKYVSQFARIESDRLALSALEDIAIVDRESKAIAIFDRDGATIARIPARGTSYQLNEPIDLAFDPLGHLFVLDRGRTSIFVFGPGQQLLATIPTAGREPRALAIDSAGRLYVFDEGAQAIQVYQ